MQIEALWIEDFGKFHQKRMSFSPGLNIMTGANESGKTTTRRFIRAMFYGLERERGLRARSDDYTKYFPWEYGRFQGSMVIRTEQGQYRIFRDFRTTEKTLRITELATGRELKEPEKFLKEAGLISEEAYLNTLWVGNVCETDEVLAEELQNYLANLTMTGAVGLNVQKSLDYLKVQKRELLKKLPGEELSGLRTLIYSENEVREGAERLSQEQAKLAAEEVRLDAEEKQSCEAAFPEEEWERRFTGLEERIQKERRRAWGFPVLVTGVLLLAAALLLFSLLNDSTVPLWTVPLLLSSALALICAGAGERAFARRREQRNRRERIALQAEQEAARTEFFNRQMLKNKERLNAVLEERKHLLAAQERLLWELERAEEQLKRIELAKEQLEREQKQREEIEKEAAAVELAIQTITKASGEMYEEFGQRFQKALSGYVKAFTDCAYERLVADEKLALSAVTAKRSVSASDVSFGTKEQFFLALRLAAADVFDEKKQLPLLLDDSFAAFDEQRLESALMCLADCGRQVLLFSSTGREEQTAKRMGIAYETNFGENLENTVEPD
ncbi:MAG: ATP-binding protein [Lachnospiraceae bacterium]